MHTSEGPFNGTAWAMAIRVSSSPAPVVYVSNEDTAFGVSAKHL